MNITIRGFETRDLDDVFELRSAPKAARDTLFLPFTSKEALRRRLEELRPHTHSLVAELEQPRKVVWMLGRHKAANPRRAHTALIGMSVHDDYQNRGIGSQLMAAVIDLAENWLNLTRLELTVFVDNAPAIHLYQKFGFEKEGVLRNYAYRDGQFVDVLTMARLRD